MTSFGRIGSDSSGAGRDGQCGRALFRADLHVHSRYSRRGHLTFPGMPAALEDPEAIYRAARHRGIDLVTLTDLDTIDGCLALLDRHGERPDLMISEEVVARDPRTSATVGVLLYDISEAQHREAQRLKGDLRELAAYLRREGIIASLSSFIGVLPSGRGTEDAAREFLALFDRLEIKNGARARSHNEMLAHLAQRAFPGRQIGTTGGSGAHSRERVGRTLTVSKAGTRREFLSDLKEGRTWAAGEDGGVLASSAEICAIIARSYRGLAPRVLLSLPLHLAAVPVLWNGLRRARTSSRVRRVRRHLDASDLVRFKEKARSYRPAAQTAEPAGRTYESRT
jgi:predicted metal-dependent phosphoesterase TrpH